MPLLGCEPSTTSNTSQSTKSNAQEKEKKPKETTSTDQPVPVVGKAAPDFEITVLGGDTLRLSKLVKDSKRANHFCFSIERTGDRPV